MTIKPVIQSESPSCHPERSEGSYLLDKLNKERFLVPLGMTKKPVIQSESPSCHPERSEGSYLLGQMNK